MADYKHKARKRFGQNFLTDKNIVGKIVMSISPQPGDNLVEIGPGLGALTRPLLAKAKRLQAVELDRDLIPRLRESCRDAGELLIHEADALEFDFSTLAEPARPLRLVGNLPYNISTPLLFHLIGFIAAIRDMHFMLQKEVVDRMAAEPDTDDYGRLSVMLQYHCAVEPLFTVPPGAFNPRPKVDSRIVRLLPHPAPPSPVENYADFSALVKQAFSQRRKTLRNNLKPILDADIIAALGIDPGTRAETLSLADFAKLANAWTGIKNK
ncbi:MAG TPA: 16S rRNA (adenine(1518)-N(6)/adenine(1519)-N(6))-dimethyltransferase RsmA [Gammaproteobacteria bacterium]|nr:16S rRNA (adenine(1518)-N(6)/adenine(1519)-N(6))-dimethyltransferase RsmA [Gammaproteobacteria bacterium]